MNINFHYYVVKTLAYYAGFGRSEEDQQKLAYYSQFVDDYYAGKYYPNGMLVHKNDILSELNYFISIGAVKETEDPDKLYFIPAFSGYTFMEAGYPSVQESTIIPFHFITKKIYSQLTQSSNDFGAYQCQKFTMEGDTLLNGIINGFIHDIRSGTAGELDEWIIKLGMLLHVCADTFSHDSFSGLWRSENWCKVKDCEMPNGTPIKISDTFSIIPIGHAEAMHVPDVLAFTYKESRYDEDGMEITNKRKNKSRFKECAQIIVDLLCDISNKPHIKNSKFSEIYNKIWFASTEAVIVDDANETYDTEKLNQIWKKRFEQINYDYPESNPYFKLSLEKGTESLAVEGSKEENLDGSGTIKEESEKELGRTYLYKADREYFLWNKYVYEHRRSVLIGYDVEPAFAIGVGDYEEQIINKESDSSFKCPKDTQVIIGRYHKGDENGQTKYRYGELRIMWMNPNINLLFAKIALSKTFYSDYIKESDASFIEKKAAIVGREHKGDENGKTRYLYKRVFIKSNMGLYLPCVPTEIEKYKKEIDMKESKGEWAEFTVKLYRNWWVGNIDVHTAMYDRMHDGDENGSTNTKFALFDIDRNAKPLTEDEFNALQG